MNPSEPERIYRSILDAYPSPVFVVDEDLRVVDGNEAARRLIRKEPALTRQERAGELLHCLGATRSADGCGRGPTCQQCAIRNSVGEAFAQRRVTRRRAKVQWTHNGQVQDVYILVTAAPFRFEGRPLALLIFEDWTELMAIRELIPICSKCKRIRSEPRFWVTLEAFFKKNWDLDFTHGLCPDCAQEYHAELEELKRARAGAS